MKTTANFKIFCEEVPQGMTAELTPGKLQKVVHLVRHGEATHNVYARTRIKEGEQCPCMSGKPGCPYLNPANEDARLTLTGRLQATLVGPKLVTTKPLPEIMFVSPLSRTLQTATIGMSIVPQLNISMIGEEIIRERMGLHVCDKRSDKAKVSKYFQRVDFSSIPEGPDDTFPKNREEEIETAKRGFNFFLTLKDRPEQSIAVVTHSSFLYNTLSKMFDYPKNSKVARRFKTGEVRCVVLTFEEVEPNE